METNGRLKYGFILRSKDLTESVLVSLTSLLLAPETLPEEKIRRGELRKYVEEAKSYKPDDAGVKDEC